MKSIEQLIFERKFKDEPFEPNDFNDWAKENAGEAYALAIEVAKDFQDLAIKQDGIIGGLYRNVSDNLRLAKAIEKL